MKTADGTTIDGASISSENGTPDLQNNYDREQTTSESDSSRQTLVSNELSPQKIRARLPWGTMYKRYGSRYRLFHDEDHKSWCLFARCPRDFNFNKMELLSCLLLLVVAQALLAVGAVAAVTCSPCPSSCQCTESPVWPGLCRVDCASQNQDKLPDKPSRQIIAEILYSDCRIKESEFSAKELDFPALRRLDVANNLLRKQFPEDLFTLTTNLEVLILRGNELDYLTPALFSGLVKLKNLSLSGNLLKTLSPTLFADLISLERLEIKNQYLTTLEAGIFTAFSQTLHYTALHNNPWRCDCDLAWLQLWLLQHTDQQGLTVGNVSKLLCLSPRILRSQNLLTVTLHDFGCDAGAFISCVVHRESGLTEAVDYSRSQSGVSDKQACMQSCYSAGTLYAAYQKSGQGTCLCGVITTSCSCPDLTSKAEPGSGETLCGKTYLRDTTSVSPGFSFVHLRPYTTQEDVTFVIDSPYPIDRSEWNFDDHGASTPYSTAGNQTLHNFFIAKDYNVQVNGTLANGSETLVAPVQVLDPVKLVNISTELLYAGLEQPFNGTGVVLQQGTKLHIQWTRTSETDQVVNGKVCREGWSYTQGRCVQSSAPPSLAFSAARQECVTKNATLLELQHQQDLSSIIALLKLGQEKYWIGATKIGTQAYHWESDGTAAYFTDVPSGHLGDCVATNEDGLVGAACSGTNRIICQQELVQCHHEGVFNTDTGLCYLATGQDAELSWTKAQNQCQQYDGNLVTMPTQAVWSFLQDYVLDTNRSYWAGLSDRAREGQYLWVDGASLGSFAAWSPTEPSDTPPPQDCVAVVTETGGAGWHDRNCSEIHPYICQFPAGDYVSSVASYLAGTAPGQSDGVSTVVNLTSQEIPNSPLSGTTVYFMPGVWFSHSGWLQTWLLNSAAVAMDTEVHLQVYRPTCPTPGEQLVPPGCSVNPSAYTECVSSPTPCSVTKEQPCDGPQQQYCPLTQSCVGVVEPCNCNVAQGSSSCASSIVSVAAIGRRRKRDLAAYKNVLLISPEQGGGSPSGALAERVSRTKRAAITPTGVRFVAAEPSYILVSETIVTIPANAQRQYRVNVDGDGVEIQVNDVIGIQFTGGKSPILCEQDANSGWQQSVRSKTFANWNTAKTDTFSFTDAAWLDGTVCYLKALYTKPVSVHPLENLLDVSVIQPGIYRYAADVTNAISFASFEYDVHFLRRVTAVSLLHPSLLSGQSVVVPSGSLEGMLFSIQQGTSAVLNWTLPTDASMELFSSTCPSAFAVTQPECSSPTTADQQFALVQCTFSLVPNSATNTVQMNVTVYNEISQESFSVEFLVQERISGLSLTEVNSGALPSTGARLTFKAMTLTGTDISYNWTTSDGHNYETYYSNLTLEFSSPGPRSVSVTAFNHLSNGTATADFLVFARDANVRDVDINLASLVLVGQLVSANVTFAADIWSHVTIVTDFGDGTQILNTSYQFSADDTAVLGVSHTYSAAGVHAANLSVTDDISGAVQSTSVTVTVVESISSVTLLGLQPYVPKDAELTLTAQVPVNTGQVYFTWDLGDGSGVHPSSSSSIQHSFTVLGDFNVTLSASNNLSAAACVEEVSVQETITSLQLSYAGPTLQGEPITINATVATGSHIQFQLLLSGAQLGGAADVGWLQHLFPAPGSYNVTVEASNDISTESAWAEVTVIPSDMWQVVAVHNDSCIALQVDTEFMAEVTAVDPTDLEYKWDFGDGTAVIVIKQVPTVSHVFQSSGNYTLTLVVSRGAGSDTLSRAVCVQEPVTGLTLSSNSPLALDRGSLISAQVTASLATGSDYLLTWTFNGVSIVVAPPGVWTRDLRMAGQSSVHVEVSNQISSVSGDVTISVYEVIQGASVEHSSAFGDYFSTAVAYEFSASALEGSDVRFEWTIGSGTYHSQNISRSFASPGQFDITLNASNAVSMASTVVNVTAQDAVGDVQLSSNVTVGTAAVPGQAVLFTAQVSSGSSLKYTWQPCLYCASVMTWDAEYVHAYPAAGNYTASVNVFNRVSSTVSILPITVRGSFFDLQIRVQNLTDDRYIAVGHPLRFIADFSSGNGNVSTEWTILSQDGTQLLQVSDVQALDHTFSTSGDYLVRLVARGDQELAQRELGVTAVELIANHQLLVNTTVPGFAALQAPYQFTAVYSSGSELTHTWWVSFPDATIVTLQDVTDTVVYSFPKIGQFEVFLKSENPLGSETTSMEIVTEILITYVEIVTDYATLPYVTKDDSVSFSSDGDTQSPLTHMWTVTDTDSDVFYGTALILTFTTLGSVNISLNISNDISSAEVMLGVIVQERVTGLTMSPSKNPTRVNEVIEFITSVSSGSSLVYQWDFGTNGTNSRVPSAESQTSHNFTEGGLYKVEVTVGNGVSQMTVTQEVVVEEPVSGVHISDCCVYPAFQGVVLRADVERGYPVFYNWSVHRDPVVHLEGDEVEVSFPGKGVYTVIVTAHNGLSTVTRQEQVTVQEPIDGVKITSSHDPDSVYVKQEVEFTASVQSGTDLEYTWAIARVTQTGREVIQGGNRTLVRTFQVPGQYLIVANVSNEISYGVDIMPLSVLEFKCDPPKATFVGDPERREIRSRPVRLEVTIAACTNFPIEHKWTFYRQECADEAKIVSLPHHARDNAPIIHLPPRTLDYGLYCVRFETQFSRTPAKDSLSVMLEITKSALQAIITGGDQVTVARDVEHILDGSMTFDPDLPKDSPSQFMFEWHCVASVEGEACFPPQFTEKVVIEANSLKAGVSYAVELTVSKAGRLNATARQQIIVRRVNVPMSSIDCVSCRQENIFSISSSQLVKLLGSCRNCQPNARYRWRALRSDGRELPLNSATTTTGNSKPNLVIRRGVLDDGHRYCFSLNISSEDFTTWGYSQLCLAPSLPPSGGMCQIKHAPVVVALNNTVQVECSGWRDNTGSNSPLMYHIYVEDRKGEPGKKDWYPIYRGTQSSVSFWLSPFDEEEGEVEVIVQIIDSIGCRTVGKKSVLFVKSRPDNPGETRLQFLQSEVSHRLLLIQRKNNPKLLLQYVITLLLQLNRESATAAPPGNTHDPDRATRELLREKLILAVNETVSISAIDDVQQLAFALQLITHYKREFPLYAPKYLIVTSFLSEILQSVTPHVSQGWEGDEIVPIYLLATIGNLIEILQYDLSVPPETDFSTGRDEDPETQPPEVLRRIIETATGLGDSIMKLLLQTQVAEEAPFIFDLAFYHSVGQRVTSDSIRQDYESSGTKVHFPTGLLDDLGGVEIFQIMSSLINNPFMWGYRDGYKVTSHVVSIFFSYANGTTVKINGLPSEKNIKVTLGHEVASLDVNGDGETTKRRRRRAAPINNQEANSEHGSVDTKAGENSPTLQDHVMLEYRTFSFKPGETLTTKLNTSALSNSTHGAVLGMSIGGLLVLPNKTVQELHHRYVNLGAYVGKGYAPHKFKSDAQLNITTGNDDNIDKNSDDDRLVHAHDRFIVQYKDLDDSEYFLTITNRNPMMAANVSVAIYASLCKFYEMDEGKWDNAGCLATNESSMMWTMCSINHLTTFGATVLVLPSGLDFEDLLGLDFSHNPVVITTVCIVALVYLAMVALARHWDVLALKRISKVPLCGTDGACKYEITVVTGIQPGAGTTANVGIKLYGDQTRSGARHLARPGAFRRASRDALLVATDRALGDVWKIHLWHDNTGMRPAWYVRRVVVRDLQSNKQFTFLCERWLSLLHHEAEISMDMFAAAPEDLKSFRNLFKAQVAKGFSDSHIWLSVLDRPVLDSFSRVQRVTCCATFVYTYLLANAVWFGLLRPPTEYELLTGNSVFSWNDLLVGAMACVCVLPVSLLLMHMFRRSRQRTNMVRHRRPSTAKTLEIDALIDLGSRESSAISNLRCRPQMIQLANLNLDRESSNESMSVHAGRLHRSEPLRLVKEENPEQTTKAGSDASSVLTSATMTREDLAKKYPSLQATSQGWWSYDTILAWPETLPAWGESSDSRQSSASSFKRKPSYYWPLKGLKDQETECHSETDKGRQERRERRAALARKLNARRVSITESIDEILEEIDPWEASTSTATKETTVTSSNASANSKTRNERAQRDGKAPKTAAVPTAAGEDFNPRDEPTLDELLAEFESDEILFGPGAGARAEKKGRRSCTSSSSSDPSPGGNSRRVSISTLAPTYFHRRDRAWSDASTTWTATQYVSPPPPLSPARHSRLLPHWCVYITYALCTCLMAVSVLMVLLYGHTFGPQLALRWLLACSISLLLSILVLEPLKVLLVAVFVAVVTKHFDDQNHHPTIVPLLESNEKIKDLKIRPIGGYALLQAKEEGRRVQRMHSLLQQLFVYLFFILLVTLCCHLYHTHDAHLVRTHVDNHFLRARTQTNVAFMDVKNTSQYWTWLEEVCAAGLHRYRELPQSTHGYPMGVARLRQVRSTSVTCYVQKALLSMGAAHLLNHGCYGNPGWTEDTASYAPGWDLSPAVNHTWMHQQAVQGSSVSYRGEVSDYGSGGYVQNLGSTQSETLDILTDLKDQLWIDRGTRAVVLEFVEYSDNVGLYTIAAYVMEFPLTGGLVGSRQVFVSRLLSLRPGHVDSVMVLQCLLFLITIYLTVHLIKCLVRYKLRYFGKFWNWVEFVITLSTVASLGMYVAGAMLDTGRLRRYHDNKSDFPELYALAHTNYAWQCLNAFLLFMLLMMIVKQLRFIKCLTLYNKVIHVASPKLVGCAIYFLLFIMAYSHMGFLWYGGVVHGFHSLGHTVGSLVAVLRGTVPFLDQMFYEVNHGFTLLFLLTFVAAMLVAVMGLALAVLTDTFKSVKAELNYHNTLDMQDYEMIEFMIKRLKRWMGLTKPKPAFRKVKFQGLASLSSASHSSYSSRSWRTTSHLSSSDTDAGDIELIDEEISKLYLDDLLDRAVPTWERMLRQVEQIEVLEIQEQEMDKQLQGMATNLGLQCQPTSTKHRTVSKPLSTGDRATPHRHPRSSSASDVPHRALANVVKAGTAPPGGKSRLAGLQQIVGRPFSDQGARKMKRDSVRPTTPAVPSKPAW